MLQRDYNTCHYCGLEATTVDHLIPISKGGTDEEGNVVPKLDMSEDGSLARLFIEKEDLHGSFDYVPDVKSMAIGVSEEAINGRNQALYILLSPGVQQQLMNEGATINVKDLLISVLEDNGVKNASKLFQSGQVNGQGATGLPGITPEQAGQGVPAGLANARGGQMPTGPSSVQGMGDISALFNTAGQPNVSQSQGLPQV